MSKNIIDFFGGIFFIVFGGAFAIFCRTLAKIAVEQQYKILHIRFNEKYYWPFFLVGGISFIILGILTLIKII